MNASLDTDTIHGAKIREAQLFVRDTIVNVDTDTIAEDIAVVLFLLTDLSFVLGITVLSLGLIWSIFSAAFGEDEDDSSEQLDESETQSSPVEQETRDQTESTTQPEPSPDFGEGDQDSPEKQLEVDETALMSDDQSETSQPTSKEPTTQQQEPESTPDVNDQSSETDSPDHAPESEQEQPAKADDPVRQLFRDLIALSDEKDQLERTFKSDYKGNVVETNAELKRIDDMEFETDFNDIREGKKGIFTLVVDPETSDSNQRCEIRVAFPDDTITEFSTGDTVQFRGRIHEFDRIMNYLLMTEGEILSSENGG